jgi:hypothetical protein
VRSRQSLKHIAQQYDMSRFGSMERDSGGISFMIGVLRLMGIHTHRWIPCGILHETRFTATGNILLLDLRFALAEE